MLQKELCSRDMIRRVALFPDPAADFFRAAKDVIPTLRGVKHTTPSIRNITDMFAEFGNRYQVMCKSDVSMISAYTHYSIPAVVE